MSLIATDMFKDLCEDGNDDDDDLDKPGSVFNSLEYQDMNGNFHDEDQSELREGNSIENTSDDKLSNGQISLDVNLSQFERSLAVQVSHVFLFVLTIWTVCQQLKQYNFQESYS